MATNIDISKKRGDTRRIVFKITDTEGLSVDITAWTALLLTINPARQPVDDTGQTEQLTGIIVDGVTGRAGFIPSGTIAIGRYYYDAQGVDDNGEIYTFAEGKFEVTQDITK